MTYEALRARLIAQAYERAVQAARENVEGAPGNPFIYQPSIVADGTAISAGMKYPGRSSVHNEQLEGAWNDAFRETYNAEIERAILDLRAQADRLAKTLFPAASESVAA